MVTNLRNEEVALQIINEIVDLSNSNPFEDGLTVMVDKNGYFTLIERSDNCNGRVVIPTTFPKFLEVANQNQELIREKRKVAKLSFSSISGVLPQSEIVGCLGAYSEGLIIDNSLTSPCFEGGQIFILVLRSTITDFAFKDEVIKDVGVPTTVLIVRTEKVLKAASTDISLSNSLDSSRKYLEVKSMFAACVKGRGRIDDDTEMYFYPYSNTSKTNFGRVCLGSVLGTDLLLFEKQSHLDVLPLEFYGAMSNTHELDVCFKSQHKLSQRQFILRHKNKPFDEDELIPMNMTYKEFISGAISTLYR